MDENYARRLRDWLRAAPGATPRPAEERDWLREIPPPQSGAEERWSVRGQLPELPDSDEELCPVIALPVPRTSDENGCRMSDAEARSRWNHPSNWHRRRQAEAEAQAEAAAEAQERSRWNHPSNGDRRREAATEAQERSRRNHPSAWRPEDEPGSR
ncbi:hypothetical protein [Amycolatopsis nalaikhensis]|uniref:Uncharacterized protein n=1 Tax=Amycolatopsis nalaikhensis TaxID=715472 RepID=A0ABY8XT47_9PSEU|nr:hypothetical protein [Amycolatopsis sp. 2-2]WIV58661.1 hypothetical protein QP939_08540 [Amycolatopsis sp. 2-2]